ncbi:unnamed protein product [Arctia plantaginis]|uniref:Uncharacterized protein n=1 Tax=Arctia plantaginis TaxID=874455 RepID=A0A8S1A564_ARCPL|nr:unnamed protein product [Arctia plantaginis]
MALSCSMSLRGPLGLLALFAAAALANQLEDIPHNEVKNWALKFGVDLWEFGRHFTKMNQIQNKYHEYNVDVVRKDGLLLVRELAAEVKNHMDFKINAVMECVNDEAGELRIESSDIAETSSATFPALTYSAVAGGEVQHASLRSYRIAQHSPRPQILVFAIWPHPLILEFF